MYALQKGAIGYVTKDVGSPGLLTAIRRAAQNELYMLPPLTSRLLTLLRTLQVEVAPEGSPRRVTRSQRNGNATKKPKRPRKKKDKRNWPLSNREKEVLNLIRQGQRNREIARELRIAESTVHKHVQNIFEKLNARNRAEALFLARS